MTKTIVFFNPHTDEEVGRWTRGADGKIGADLAVLDILTAALRHSSEDEAWERYTSWSNGYLSSELVESPEAAPAGS